MKINIMLAAVLLIVGCAEPVAIVDIKKMMQACNKNGEAVSLYLDTDRDVERRIDRITCTDGAIFKRQDVLGR